jgi:hypothetical protein
MRPSRACTAKPVYYDEPDQSSESDASDDDDAGEDYAPPAADGSDASDEASDSDSDGGSDAASDEDENDLSDVEEDEEEEEPEELTAYAAMLIEEDDERAADERDATYDAVFGVAGGVFGSPAQVESDLRDAWVLAKAGLLGEKLQPPGAVAVLFGDAASDAAVAAVLAHFTSRASTTRALELAQRACDTLVATHALRPRAFGEAAVAGAMLWRMAHLLPAAKRNGLLVGSGATVAVRAEMVQAFGPRADELTVEGCIARLDAMLDSDVTELKAARFVLRNITGAVCHLMKAARERGDVTPELMARLRTDRAERAREGAARRGSVRFGRKRREDKPGVDEVKVVVRHAVAGAPTVYLVEHVAAEALRTATQAELLQLLAGSKDARVGEHLASHRACVMVPATATPPRAGKTSVFHLVQTSEAPKCSCTFGIEGRESSGCVPLDARAAAARFGDALVAKAKASAPIPGLNVKSLWFHGEGRPHEEEKNVRFRIKASGKLAFSREKFISWAERTAKRVLQNTRKETARESKYRPDMYAVYVQPLETKAGKRKRGGDM